MDIYNWVINDGDNTHAITHDLNEDSIVFDIGGYNGKWASQIFEKYKCNIFIIEPITEYYNNMVTTFSNNSKIKIYNVGFSDSSRIEKININNDSTSLYKKDNSAISSTIQLLDIVDFFIFNNIQHVDLMQINIEGEEYNLLKHMIKHNLISRISNIQIQFHNWIENSVLLRNEIHSKLKLSHFLTYNYDFVWENWKKIN